MCSIRSKNVSNVYIYTLIKIMYLIHIKLFKIYKIINKYSIILFKLGRININPIRPNQVEEILTQFKLRRVKLKNNKMIMTSSDDRGGFRGGLSLISRELHIRFKIYHVFLFCTVYHPLLSQFINFNALMIYICITLSSSNTKILITSLTILKPQVVFKT
jgi:hypothetical protein